MGSAGAAGARGVGSRRFRRSALVDPGIEWQQHGVEPRWVGMETSDCAAALEPSIFHGHGATELQRFFAGAGARHETALIVATIGDVNDDSPRSPLATADASVSLPELRGTISGIRLPSGGRPSLAAELSPADRDLGLRLLNRPDDAPWWSLKLSGVTLESGAGGGSTRYEPGGELEPILVDGLGDPVVAAWASAEDDQRWYVIPDATDWNGILDWLIHRALPAHVPGALRRVRSPHFIDPGLQTEGEATVRRALGDLEERYAEEKSRLEDALRRASAAADPVRYGLLYGTGAELVEAVGLVLARAGFTTVNLDLLLGSSASADLLVTYEQQRRLVEIKSASGNASEALVADLTRHLETWPQIRPHEPVGGGVLIVNHQHQLDPQERTSAVYRRREFVDALTVPVLGTRDLFEWWRASDWTWMRQEVLGERNQPAEEKPWTPMASPTPESAPVMRPRWPRLRRRRNSA